jgi:alpha-N-arabinofuranosidase
MFAAGTGARDVAHVLVQPIVVPERQIGARPDRNKQAGEFHEMLRTIRIRHAQVMESSPLPGATGTAPSARRTPASAGCRRGSRYDRKGPKIIVGEWGAYETPFEPWNPRSRNEAPTPNLRAAIGDAAWMTEMERNSDLVIMHGYAPLLVNVSPGARQLAPEPDRLRRAGGLRIAELPRDQAVCESPWRRNSESQRHRHGRTRVGHPRQPLADDLREARERGHRGRARAAGHRRRLASPAGTAVTLAGDRQDTNSIDTPERVAPKTSQVTGVKSGFTYTVPANGIVVLELGTR